MFNFIERLRNKPESHRKAFALGAALVLTLVIFGVWMTAIFPNVVTLRGTVAQDGSRSDSFTSSDSTETTKVELAAPAEKRGTFTFITDLRVNMAQAFQAVKIQWNSLSNYLNNVEYESTEEVHVFPSDRR